MEENMFRWFWRHAMGMLTFGYMKRLHYRAMIPICDACVERIKNEEIHRRK
jgi:hypothetical protein